MVGTQVWTFKGHANEDDRELIKINQIAREWNSRPLRVKRNGKLIESKQ